MTRFTRIRGLSDDRQLPRIAKIRLGVKVPNKSGRGDHPDEVAYFVTRPEDFRKPAAFKRFRAIYGEKPTRLEIMFPIEDLGAIFPQAYKKYGAGGLRCTGDGFEYFRIAKEDGAKSKGKCPAPGSCTYGDPDCKQVGNLQFLLPRVDWGGTFQIDTSSKIAIVKLNSAFDYFRSMAGRLRFVPLLLCREPQEISHDGKKTVHYPMNLRFPDSKAEIVKLLESAKEMREVFDVFKPTVLLELPSRTEIEGDLYRNETTRKAIEGGATDVLPKDEEPPDDHDEPEPDEKEEEREELDEEEGDRCAWCNNSLDEERYLFKGEEFCSIVCLGEAKDGAKKLGPAEKTAKEHGSAVADEVKKKRLKRQGKTEDKDDRRAAPGKLF